MNKAEFVAAQLKQKILAGTWSVGDKLPSESMLSEEYGVSRLTVRSAVNTLCAQGISQTVQGKGTFLVAAPQVQGTPFLNQDVSQIDLFEFRRFLEAESAALAAQRASSSVIQQLRNSALAMQSTTDPSVIAQCDADFHRLLSQATQNTVIIQIFALLSDAFSVMFQRNVSALGASGYQAHLKIVSALEARNPELAKQYMQEHLNRTMEQTNMLHYSEAHD